MTSIIIKQPHPLDRLWTLINLDLEQADDALEALPEDCSDEDRDAAVNHRLDVIHAMMALPARHMDDCLTKLIASGCEGGDSLPGCNVREILNEATRVMDAGLSHGVRLLKAAPGLLEGVSP
ncbi:hypothetical protein N6H05_08380 [Sphingobium sp. WTD-1]|uniref:hypothetical protein n=1 Tax=Sphingobium sp. WTD-1 TaxID=2979467 RepID=UPI0024DE0344|nr:hypothetical protein [Sphingobium sp. WTD-1]WIA57798.1 hypothetical protein N6H05_08380 [Sphingobium sp. WTD-1]